ncbi:hypothetical protein BGY98DRAFT_1103980 [Russula aff. rugulosa BPL654]|nr:hypothetical protein BGY98DRAFT_1103980 [Russula aff. rugulosa BPL654]
MPRPLPEAMALVVVGTARDRSDGDNSGKQYRQCHSVSSLFFIIFVGPVTPNSNSRLRASIATTPKFRTPGLHLELLHDPSIKHRTRIHSTMAYPRSRTRVSSDASRLQRYLHLDRSQSSLIRTFPEFPGSVRNLVLGAVAYIACWILEIRSFTPIIVVGHPLILRPLLLSLAHFLLGILICQLERDALAETCYFYAQKLSTVVTLLPRAGLTLAPLLSFFSPEKLLGGLSLSDVDHTIAHRDGTFFDKNKGALSSYAKGVLIANAAWVGG